MLNKIIFIGTILCMTLSVHSQYRTERYFLKHEGRVRSYEIYFPKTFNPQKNYPVVLILHGGGGKARGIIRNTRGRFNQLAEKDNFLAVYPEGFEKSWNDGARDTLGIARKMNIDDVGFISKLIDELAQKYHADLENIFACGISNGGFMVQRLAFELSDKISAIGVVAANLSTVQSQKQFPDNPVPAIFINGTEDPLVPYDGGYVTVFRQKRGKILSVPETLKTWRQINGCSEKISGEKFPDKNKRDRCTAEKTTWQNPDNQHIKTVAIKVLNGGHTWPGSKQYLPRRLVGNTNRDFNGCDEIWDFFKLTF